MIAKKLIESIYGTDTIIVGIAVDEITGKVTKAAIRPVSRAVEVMAPGIIIPAYTTVRVVRPFARFFF